MSEVDELREKMVAAIEAYARADELIADGDLMTDVFVVGAALPSLEEQDDEVHSRIFTVAGSASTPNYIAVGLLTVGLDHLRAP